MSKTKYEKRGPTEAEPKKRDPLGTANVRAWCYICDSPHYWVEPCMSIKSGGR